MNTVELIESLGFPIVSIIGMALYLNKIQTENRADMREQNERIIAQMRDVMESNKMLLDTNATLVKSIDIKLDKLLEKEE